MTEQLTKKIEDLESQIAASDDASRALLIAKLEEVAKKLEEAGGVVPRSAHTWLRGQDEDEVEAQFDNLPV